MAAFAAGLAVFLEADARAGVSLTTLVLGAALWQTDNAISSRWPRSRRPQWAARGLLLAAIVMSSAHHAAGAAASAFLAGGSAAIVSRDQRPRRRSTFVVAAALGLVLGVAASSLFETRARLAMSLVALLGGAMSCLGATFRGGPGRIPVRPIDVAWLYVLGALLAVALSLPR